jgi:Reverse transcriptase (RNA-dependent DNA polymerase)
LVSALTQHNIVFDLTRKARFVAGGHMTDPPKDTTYSSVVSRDNIRIAFLIAALNELDILACDIQGAYLNAETKELIYTVTGLEHGAHREGQKVIIKGALYGLKLSGACWRDHLANTLRDFGYTSCKADLDIWMKPKSKPNGDKYWVYVLVYVDYILCISHKPKKFMEMGTTFWRDAINKEMVTVAHVFEFVKDDEIPGNYQFVLCHMVFDVKMDLTRKARFVAGGHMTDPPKDTTYSSVVSRDSIRIAFLIAALNDLDILACDIQGAYLNAETKELIYTVAGLEHGAHREGQKAIIKGALYGLKLSGAHWRDHLANTLRDFGYTSCKADPDIETQV